MKNLKPIVLACFISFIGAFATQASTRDQGATEADFKSFTTSRDYQEASDFLQDLKGKQVRKDLFSSRDLVKFILEKPYLRLPILHQIISIRCTTYALFAADSYLCSFAVFDMLRFLDFDVKVIDVPGHAPSANEIPTFVLIAFKKELISLLNNEKTSDYLAGIKSGLIALTNPDSQVKENIQATTERFYPGDKEFAITAIGALFQDTSEAQLHLEYLARQNINGSKFYAKNFGLLKDLINYMTFFNQNNPDLYQRYFFPNALLGKVNAGPYHYYVPMALAIKLKNGLYPNRYARMAPFLLNTTYEFISLSKGFTYFLTDPQKLDSSRMGTIRDIFVGFVGALAGTDTKIPLLDFDQIVQAFNQSTYSGMKILVNP